jgi:pilus assembly protein Flp/PilA
VQDGRDAAPCRKIARLPQRRSINVQTFFLRFFGDSSGATAIEYALVACGVAVAIVAVIGQLAATVSAKFELVSTRMK